MKSLALAVPTWPLARPRAPFPGLAGCVVAVTLPPTPSPAPHRKVKPNSPHPAPQT